MIFYVRHTFETVIGLYPSGKFGLLWDYLWDYFSILYHLDRVYIPIIL